MEPSKSEGVSRQSSILKPPKQRQPLQCVATNPPSSENSPTVKLKRRVSFAKNKRIREFCNEAEQGTVWDDTYEEHDLSSTKSSNGTDNPIIINVPCDDKENFPVQLFLPPDQLDYKEIRVEAPVEKGDSVLQEDMEIDSSINNLELINKFTPDTELQYPNTTIYCDDVMDMTNYVQSDIIIEPHKNNLQIDDTLPVSHSSQETNSQDVPASYVNCASNSTDLTQAISQLLGGGCANKQINPVDSRPYMYNLDTFEEKTMEFTSILPCSTWIQPNSQCEDREKTENLTTNMEFTEAVSYPGNSQNINKNNDLLKNTDSVIKPLTITESVPICSGVLQSNAGNSNILVEQKNQQEENLQISCNKSMDITKAIISFNKTHEPSGSTIQEQEKLISKPLTDLTEVLPTCDRVNKTNSSVNQLVPEVMQKKAELVNNTSMEMSEAISTHKNYPPIVNKIQEKTTLFGNNSMEMTEAVPVCNRIHQTNPISNKVTPELMQEKTGLFNNKSMEITEAISSQHKDYLLILNKTQEKTRLFGNNSMEMTEAISTHKNYPPIVNKIQEKTTLFGNNSMETPEAVPVCNRIHQTNPISNKVTPELMQEKTELFNNKSMEITEAISSQHKDYPFILNKTQEKTKLFGNNSMEMTEALSTHKTYPSTVNRNQEKTTLFGNNSMEMTEAVPVCNRIHQTNPISYKVTPELMQEKTELFNNKSMEITEAISSQHKDYPLILNKSQEKTRLFGNNSMEMTEAISTHKNYPSTVNRNQEKTTLFGNNSMEMTDAVPACNRIHQTNPISNKVTPELMQEKTELFNNKSMEITEAVSSQHKNYPLINKTQERTTLFGNNSMEMTEAISTHKNYPSTVNRNQEKTTLFGNNSMEMTEAVPAYNRIYQTNPISNKVTPELMQEKTELFNNKSMEITEAISSQHKDYPLILNKSQEKTRLFGNNSMEMTEAISTHKNYPSTVNRNQEKTTLFGNNSMEMTEAVPVCNRIHQTNPISNKVTPELMQEKTELFNNKSMEITEAVSSHHKNYPLINKTQERTTLFGNNSMEMTEAVLVGNKIVKVIPDVMQEKTEAISSQHKIGSSSVSKFQEKTTLFSDKSMDITKGVPMSNLDLEKNSIRGHEKTKFFNNSMEITEAIVCQNFKAHNNRAVQEKTTVFENKSMEMTEPLHMKKNNLQLNNNTRNSISPINNGIEKDNPDVMQNKTNSFNNISMEMTNAIPSSKNIMQPQIENVLSIKSKQTNQNFNKTIQENNPVSNKAVCQLVPDTDINEYRITHDKTKMFTNNSMEMTEIVTEHKNSQSGTGMHSALHNKTHEKTKKFCNKSMEITEAVTHQNGIFQSGTDVQKVNKLIMQDCKNYDNKSSTMSEVQKTIASKNSYEAFQENTDIFLNKSMEMTEAVPVYNTLYESNANTNKIQHKSMRKYSNIIYNRSLNTAKAAEGHKIIQPSTYSNEKTKYMLNKSNDITENVPVQQRLDNLPNLIQNNITQENTKKFFDKSMDVTEAISYSKSNYEIPEISCKESDKEIQPLQNMSIDITSLSKNYPQNNEKSEDESRHKTNPTEVFNDSLMEYTEVLPSVSRNSLNSSHFRKEYEMIDKYHNSKDNNFHRITSDELNTLCASMNLPTQKYEKNENITGPNLYLSSCNDVNVLRNSLKNNTIFQQREPLTQSSFFSQKDKDNVTVSGNCSETFADRDKKLQRQENENMPGVTIHSMLQVSTMDKNKSTEIRPKNPECPEAYFGLPSYKTSTDIDANKKHLLMNQNISTNDIDNPNKIRCIDMNNEQRIIPSNDNDINKFDTNVKNISSNNSNTLEKNNFYHSYLEPKNKIQIYHDESDYKCDSKRRKISDSTVDKNKQTIDEYDAEFLSTEICDENNIIYKENSLSRFPSDSTEVLIATTCCKPDSSPLLINEKKIIQIPSQKSFINKTYTVDALSNADQQIKSNKSVVIDSNTNEDAQLTKNKTFVVNSNTNVEAQVTRNKTFIINSNTNTETQVNLRRTFVVNSNSNVQIHTKSSIEVNEIPSIQKQSNNFTEIPIVLPSESEKNSIEENTDSSNKENKEPKVRTNLFSDNNTEGLEEIQPPSFLYSDSIQDDVLECAELPESNDVETPTSDHVHIPNTDNAKPSNIDFNKPDCALNNKNMDEATKENNKLDSPLEIVKSIKLRIQKLSCDTVTKSLGKVSNKKQKCREDNELVEEKEKEVVKEPLTPFVSLTVNLQNNVKSNDCIWAIRMVDPEIIAIDFISQSLVLVITLNGDDQACIQDIKDIQIISRIKSSSENVFLKIVHKLLLLLFKPSKMLLKYRMYEDVLPMLEYVSNEVKSSMKFMFDLQRLDALNLLCIDIDRITFTVASKKSNIILKVSLLIKLFNEISPDDIDVIIILGDIRINDIKQLIINIKRDYSFLSRYIDDVIDYITLMEESVCLSKH